jgi:hypothetical protein
MRFKKTSSKSSSVRQPRQNVGESFRRNNVVISRSQKELAQHQQSVTQRQMERKRSEMHRRFKRRIITVIAAILLVMLAMRMNPSSITTTSNASSKLNAEKRALYEASWQKSYKKSTFLGQYWMFDEAAFKNLAMHEFPEIEDITVKSSVPFGKNLEVDARFRRAVFTWRDASGETQFVDKNGVLFSKDLDASVDTKKLIGIEDQSGTVLEPGNPVLTTNLVKFVGHLHDKTTSVFPTKQIAKVIVPRSTREIQLQMTGVPYLIKFSSERNLDEQIAELKTLVDYLISKGIQPASYIDIRVPHKAFYK